MGLSPGTGAGPGFVTGLLVVTVYFHGDEGGGIATPYQERDVSSFRSLVKQLIKFLDSFYILVVDAENHVAWADAGTSATSESAASAVRSRFIGQFSQSSRAREIT